MARITIDPVTRIEGHLRMETEVVNGAVTGAWSTGTLFRGIETILRGRDPREAWLYTQRLCGVCTYVHAAGSVKAVENAANVTLPKNARIIRNLLMATQHVQDHVIHFYQLHALDWVDVVSALSADPARTAALAADLSPNAKPIDFSAVKARLQAFAGGGQLGPFANGYWGHPAYKLPPEANLLFMAHYLEALGQQNRTARMHAIFGGKNPHPHGMIIGGVTCYQDITRSRLTHFRTLWQETKQFVDTIYIPDLYLLASYYPEWAAIGGFPNLLTFGEFPQGTIEPDTLFFPRGAIFNRDYAHVAAVDTNVITEHVAHSWYQGSTALHPSGGVTQPVYTGLDVNTRYSWLKAPRYNGDPMEVGPLARVMVAYGRGQQQTRTAVDAFLSTLGLSTAQMFSTLGRTAARALETQVMCDAMGPWISELEGNVGGDTRIANSAVVPLNGSGYSLTEAPRGALGHWITIGSGMISNYQMVIPSTWNFGPRCSANKPGPVEQALVNTPTADSARPVEILRTIHSYDPCIACAVHVVDLRERGAIRVATHPGREA